jgi:thioredoxin 1
METGTFLQENVIEYIGRNFVPLKYESGRDGEQFMRFNVRGTPTFLVLDSEGNETRRMLGYFDPDDFIAQLEAEDSKQ